MNNATIALNVARPVAPTPSPASGAASASSVPGKGSDDTAANKRFDAAMDAAHADARKTKDDSSDKSTTASTTASSVKDTKDTSTDKTASAQGDKKPDDDATKKDDASDSDTSLATSVLALLGVPPKLGDLAAKALGTATTVAGKLGDALGALTGSATTPGLATAAASGAAAKDGAAGLATMDALAVATPAAASAASPFASLLAVQGGDLAATKDDASDTDLAASSPMPLMHAPAMTGVAAPAVQVQATQAATSPQFGQELGEQIAWMGSGDVKSARIKLHPEELGSMDVHVTMDGGKVNVAILAQHPAAVHAVQQTLSQLDTMLAHHGLSLGQADVGQRNPGQAPSQNDSAGGQGGSAADETAANTVVATSRVSRSLVDEVA